ncbi:UNVERIFIED_CONTAM: hypothetical protein RF648_20765, partial [Kocuria sp. CPCC 205274]
GKWQNMGNGIEANTLTGESRQIPGYQPTQPNLHYLRNADGTYTAVNPKTNEVVGGTVGTPKAGTGAAGGVTGGGIGLDEHEAGAAKPSSSNMTVTDPDGKKWTVATNSRGTPIVDAKTGMATVYDEQGNVGSRIYNETYTQQSGQIAQEGLNNIQDLRTSGLLHNTGSGMMDRAKRYAADATGGNYTANINSTFSNINDQVHALAVNK